MVLGVSPELSVMAFTGGLLEGLGVHTHLKYDKKATAK